MRGLGTAVGAITRGVKLFRLLPRSERKKGKRFRERIGCGGRTRTDNFHLMRVASYLCYTPRYWKGVLSFSFYIYYNINSTGNQNLGQEGLVEWANPSQEPALPSSLNHLALRLRLISPINRGNSCREDFGSTSLGVLNTYETSYFPRGRSCKSHCLPRNHNHRQYFREDVSALYPRLPKVDHQCSAHRRGIPLMAIVASLAWRLRS